MENERRLQLFVELQGFEKEGIMLSLEGTPSNPLGITNAIFINEEDAYMRDYVYQEGVLTEVRFDRVRNL